MGSVCSTTDASSERVIKIQSSPIGSSPPSPSDDCRNCGETGRAVRPPLAVAPAQTTTTTPSSPFKAKEGGEGTIDDLRVNSDIGLATARNPLMPPQLHGSSSEFVSAPSPMSAGGGGVNENWKPIATTTSGAVSSSSSPLQVVDGANQATSTSDRRDNGEGLFGQTTGSSNGSSPQAFSSPSHNDGQPQRPPQPPPSLRHARRNQQRTATAAAAGGDDGDGQSPNGLDSHQQQLSAPLSRHNSDGVAAGGSSQHDDDFAGGSNGSMTHSGHYTLPVVTDPSISNSTPLGIFGAHRGGGVVAAVGGGGGGLPVAGGGAPGMWGANVPSFSADTPVGSQLPILPLQRGISGTMDSGTFLPRRTSRRPTAEIILDEATGAMLLQGASKRSSMSSSTSTSRTTTTTGSGSVVTPALASGGGGGGASIVGDQHPVDSVSIRSLDPLHMTTDDGSSGGGGRRLSLDVRRMSSLSASTSPVTAQQQRSRKGRKFDDGMDVTIIPEEGSPASHAALARLAPSMSPSRQHRVPSHTGALESDRCNEFSALSPSRRPPLIASVGSASGGGGGGGVMSPRHRVPAAAGGGGGVAALVASSTLMNISSSSEKEHPLQLQLSQTSLPSSVHSSFRQQQQQQQHHISGSQQPMQNVSLGLGSTSSSAAMIRWPVRPSGATNAGVGDLRINVLDVEASPAVSGYHTAEHARETPLTNRNRSQNSFVLDTMPSFKRGDSMGDIDSLATPDLASARHQKSSLMGSMREGEEDGVHAPQEMALFLPSSIPNTLLRARNKPPEEDQDVIAIYRKPLVAVPYPTNESSLTDLSVADDVSVTSFASTSNNAILAEAAATATGPTTSSSPSHHAKPAATAESM